MLGWTIMNHLWICAILAPVPLSSHVQKDIVELEIISKIIKTRKIVKDVDLFPDGTKLRHTGWAKTLLSREEPN